jgi:hypothetical protein
VQGRGGGRKKSPLDNNMNYNCFRQESSVDASQDKSLKVSPHKILIIVNHFIQVVLLISPVMVWIL